MRKRYTEDETVLCTYIARFGRGAFGEKDVEKVEGRSLSSIKMKVQNIASMLDEEKYEVSKEVSKLTGRPQGESGRRTDWDVVKPLAILSKEEHLKRCRVIFDKC